MMATYNAYRNGEEQTEADAVVVEYMPECWRASHEAAGNSGIYPHNGAQRFAMERKNAEAFVESEGDEEWCRIVDGADPSEYEFQEDWPA